MSLLRGNIIYNAALSMSQVLFPLITFPYASRVLGPEAIGAVSFADSFITYFLTFAALGIPLYGIREIAKVGSDRVKLGIVVSELLFIHFLTSFIAIIVVFFVSYFTGRLNNNFQLYQIGMLIILGNVFIAEWFFQGLGQFKYIAGRSILIRVFTMVLLFLLVRTPDDKNIYYGLNLITIILAAATNMIAICKRVQLSFLGMSLSRHLKPLVIIFSNTVISTIYLVFDSIILGFLTDDLHVGYYSASMRLSKISLTVVSVLSAVLLPTLTVAFQNNDLERAKSLLKKSLEFVVFLSIPIAMGSFCLSKEIILLLVGPAYLPSVPSFQILCFIVIVLGLAQIFSHQILLPLHQEKKVLIASIAGVVISLSLNFLLIPVYKHVGAGIASFVTEAGVTVMLFVFVRKSVAIDFPFRKAFHSVLTCCLFFAVKYAVVQIVTKPLPVVALTVLLSGGIYFTAQFFLWKNESVFELTSGLKKLMLRQKL